MPFQEKEEYIREKLGAKGINIETQDYVIKYVHLNQQLFSNFINIDTVIDRVVNNLDYSISRLDRRSIIYPLLRKGGGYDPQKKMIRQNPLNKLLSFISKENKDKQTSVIMHEIDHCATTKYLNKEQTTFVFGIVDYDYPIDLNKLNEGITSYKQELYDEALGNNSHTQGYSIETDVARFIADIIGKEELISMHFNNDYHGIRQVFNEKTRKDLNDLVKKLNSRSYIRSRVFGKLYTNRFSKEIHDYMEGFKVEKRNNDFVSKCEINYSKVEENIKQSKILHKQEQERDEGN